MNQDKLIAKVQGKEYKTIEVLIDGVVHQFFVDKLVYEQGQYCPLLSFGTLLQNGDVQIKKDTSK